MLILATINNRPWIAQFHSTEFDRRGQKANALILQIEKDACGKAAHIIVPNSYTRNTLTRLYGANIEKISVIPNCFEIEPDSLRRRGRFESRSVLFAGRMTEQKGPDYFVEAAAEISKRMNDVKFTMYGSGDMTTDVQRLLQDKFDTGMLAVPSTNASHTPQTLLESHIENVTNVKLENEKLDGAEEQKETIHINELLYSYNPKESSSTDLAREFERKIRLGGFLILKVQLPGGQFLIT